MMVKTYYANVFVYNDMYEMIDTLMIDSYMQNEDEAIRDIVNKAFNKYEDAETVHIEEFFMVEDEVKDGYKI